MGKKKMRKYAVILLGAVVIWAISGCQKSDIPNPEHPVTITIWHTYVEGMRDSFDMLVNEFNDTIGKENGITVKVTAIANASVLNEQIVAAANQDPGAPEMPDMLLAYPKIAVTLAEMGVLINLEEQFSEEELSVFYSSFLEEGRLNGDKLYLLPIAKSTEVLYVNRTLFDRFAKETGVSLSSLSTFEGIAEVSETYYNWTDGKTPVQLDDGKMFYYPDGLFNYAMIGFQQLGGDIVNGAKLSLSDPIFERIWNSYFNPAVKGGVAIYNDYGNYLAATGDIICCSSTSAGASFYPDHVTYADNTKEDVVFDVLPYPVFEGGEKVAFQRGGGICITKSTKPKEYASGMFLKWITVPEQNLRFTASTGYLPVQSAAFTDVLNGKYPPISNSIVKKSLITAANMKKDYRFYFPPVFDGFDDLQTDFTEQIQSIAREEREIYLTLIKKTDVYLESASKTAYTNIIKMYRNKG
jgi:multiple sugar transport system substrate-binding protein